MKESNKAHETYWQKEKILEFEDYERNEVLPSLFSKNDKVLDLGCGDGAVASFIKDKVVTDVIGVDFAPTALKRAKQRGIPVILSDVSESLPLQSSSFDSVFFGDVVEHIYHPHMALEEIHRVLKPRGKLIITCPNMGYWRYRAYYLIHGMLPDTEWIAQEPWESQHIRFFNKNLLYKLLLEKGFEPKLFLGISRRRLDKPLLSLFPQVFGMIMIVVAEKQ